MMIKVVNDFTDKNHGHTYRVGDTYPADGYNVEVDRVSMLSKPHDKTGKVYLFVENESNQVESDKPKRGRKKAGEVNGQSS